MGAESVAGLLKNCVVAGAVLGCVEDVGEGVEAVFGELTDTVGVAVPVTELRMGLAAKVNEGFGNSWLIQKQILRRKRRALFTGSVRFPTFFTSLIVAIVMVVVSL